MNPFTEHTRKQGLTYLEHWCFAMGVAWRLASSVIAFSLHAIFPFIHIQRRLDFEATIEYIYERNEWIANAKFKSRKDGQASAIESKNNSEGSGIWIEL